MAIEMQKKFRFEKFLVSRTKRDAFERAIAEASCQISSEDFENLSSKDLIEKIIGLFDFKDDSDGGELVTSLFREYLQEGIDGIRERQNHYNVMCSHLFKPVCRLFKIEKTFFPVLKKAKTEGLRWECLKLDYDQVVVIKLPEALQFAKEGFEIDEFSAAVTEYRDIEGKVLSFMFLGRGLTHGGGIGTMYVPMLPEGPIKIEHDLAQICSGVEKIASLFIKTLIYAGTGKPDLNEFRNAIKYKTIKGEKKPVREHREYTTRPYTVLGFGWMKERQQFIDSWGVEPFMRLQPVGPGRKEYKYTLVRAHTRTRRPKEYRISSEGMEAGAPS